jgi:teichuronic acid biosynthesis glycosyltransferase TuaC
VRVLVLTNMYPDEGGRGPFVKDQVQDLRELGLEVDVLAFNGAGNTTNYARAMRRLHTIVRETNYDLVHAHYGLTGAVAITQHRTPVITTFHGSDCSGQSSWRSGVSWVVARRTIPIFVSAVLAKRLGLPSAVVIPAGVDIDAFRPRDKTAARRKLKWHEQCHYALLPGRRDDRNKRADLFDAALQCARANTPDLRAVSLDGLTRAEVALAMAASDVMVMTSDYEGSPVTVKESLACRTPVVSVDVGDVPAVIADLPGCAVVPRDPAPLGEAVAAAIGLPPRSELRVRAERYSRGRIANRVASVYEAVASRAAK